MPYSAKEAKRVALGLIGLELLLTALYLLLNSVVRWRPLDSLFNLGADVAIPAWFSSTQLFVVGAVLLFGARNDRHERRAPPHVLALLGWAFVFLSADEGAVIHERVTVVVSDAGFTWLLFRGNHGGWISLYVVAALVVGMLVRRSLRRLWVGFRREVSIGLAGMAVYVSGAVIIEVVGYQLRDETTHTQLDTLSVALEEFLEMSGVTIVLYAALLLALRVSTPSTPR